MEGEGKQRTIISERKSKMTGRDNKTRRDERKWELVRQEL